MGEKLSIDLSYHALLLTELKLTFSLMRER